MHPLGISLIVYIIVIIIILTIKPDSVYDKKRKKFKEFGSGHSKTLFPMWLVAIVVGIFSYVFVNIINSLFFQSQEISVSNSMIPINNVQPVQPVHLVQPIQSVQPVHPVQSVHPVQPVHTVQPTQSKMNSVSSQNNFKGRTNRVILKPQSIPNSKVWMNAME